MSEIQYTRDEYVYLSKLYDRAGRYDDMLITITKFAQMNPNLNSDERIILSAGYKNVISFRRKSWRLLNGLEKKEKKNSHNLLYIKEIKIIVEDEIRKICDKVQDTLEKYLIFKAKDYETRVFYLKFKGDYFRYAAEFTNGEEKHIATKNAELAYKEAYNISEKTFPIGSTTRLGLVLNFSVFYYEIKKSKKEACQITKIALDECVSIIDDLEKNKVKDTLMIIQLLKENLVLWNNEIDEEEKVKLFL